MNASYPFEQQETKQIIDHFGPDFYEQVLHNIDIYADQWALSDFQLIPSYSANLVFRCFSKHHGPTVLKMGRPSSREIGTEWQTLREYNGRRFCQVFEADLKRRVILEQCIQPGTTLRDEPALETRLAVFCSMYQDLHIPPANASIYPTYIEWVTRITNEMNQRSDCRELYIHMKQAEAICLSVSGQYSRNMLLHGDLHHDNMLLEQGGQYRLIDPKGVLGDPVFDIPRFILNEFGDAITTELHAKIHDIIRILASKLQIPGSILKQCLYVETAMGMCWSAEDGVNPEEYVKLLEAVSFAETIMKT